MIQATIEIAVKKAQQSRCKYHVSAIGFDKRGRIVATARNYPRFNYEGGGVHAEMALLKKAGVRVRTLLLCRMNRIGVLKRIDPCPACQRVLDRM